MNKNCFVCGNDWCLNLIDDPVDPEDNVCDNCRNLPADKKCPECTNQKAMAKKDLYQIIFYVFILFLITLILSPFIVSFNNIIRL